MATEDPEEVVRLLTAPNPAIAHVWQQALAAQGIRARVVGDYLDASYGDLPGTKPELWVRRKDVARATEILRDEVVGEPDAQGLDEDDEEDESDEA